METAPTNNHSFTELLTNLKSGKVRSDSFLYEQLGACLNAYQTGLKDGTVGFSENVKLLDEECTSSGIKISSDTRALTKLVKLAVNDDPKIASGYAKVLSIADNCAQTHDSFSDWVKKNNGLESVRNNFNWDGTPRSASPNAKTRKSPHIVTEKKLLQAKSDIAAAELYKMPADITRFLGAPPTTEKNYAAILRHCPDGTLIIAATTDFPEALNAVYSGYVAATDATSMDQKIDNMMNRAHISPKDLKELSAEIAEDESGSWESRKFYSEIPAELEDYEDKLTDADRTHNINPASAAQKYITAFDSLTAYNEAPGYGTPFETYLDRSIDESITPDKESVPRLITSRSRENIKPLLRQTRRQHIKTHLQGYRSRRKLAIVRRNF